MKTLITYKILLLLTATSGVAIAGTGEHIGEVQEFLKGKITCYCTEARTKGLRLDKEVLMSALQSDGQSTDILACGEKELMLVKVPIGNGDIDLDVDVAGTCYAGAEPDADGNFSCWIKKNYIRYTGDCGSGEFAGDPNVDEHPKCKDLGAVVGAGRCEKD